MNVLLVAEYRKGSLLGSNNELIGFAQKIGADSSMFLVGDPAQLPPFEGTLYLADAAAYGEYNPDVHKQLLLGVIDQMKPDYIVLEVDSESFRSQDQHASQTQQQSPSQSRLNPV